MFLNLKMKGGETSMSVEQERYHRDAGTHPGKGWKFQTNETKDGLESRLEAHERAYGKRNVRVVKRAFDTNGKPWKIEGYSVWVSEKGLKTFEAKEAKRCKATLQMSCDFGDNPVTFCCQRNKDHFGKHRESGNIGEKLFIIHWE